MKYIDEYRNKELVLSIAAQLHKISTKKIALMEVCGGHTMSIHRFGLAALLPDNIRLISGPGCPVCVSGQQFIDRAIAYSQLPDAIITTYGDLIRVPGTNSSLEKEKAAGHDIRIVYSTLDALEIAKANPAKKAVFLGVGFETTAPATAAAILEAKKAGLINFLVLSAHKVMPPVMKSLVDDGVAIDGFIAPGHVSAITGTHIFDELAEQYYLGVVVAGFEPTDLMQAILILTTQIENGTPKVENCYHRVVNSEGNKMAQEIMNQVFELRDEQWRGFGMIPLSGLKIKAEYSDFDAEIQLNIVVPQSISPKGCICGQILRGVKQPADCKLFNVTCNSINPVGACMVSAEGTCATYYKYRQ